MQLITITGPSGAGKDTVARMLADETGFSLIVSYTTRPMRDGEVNGREHHFVNECNTPKDQMLAYTNYGGHEYWTTVQQAQVNAIYVIDEKGLKDLHERFPQINIFSVYVTANEAVRRERGVTQERINRDLQREEMPLDCYDYRITNNKSVKALKHKVMDLKQCIIY